MSMEIGDSDHGELDLTPRQRRDWHLKEHITRVTVAHQNESNSASIRRPRLLCRAETGALLRRYLEENIRRAKELEQQISTLNGLLDERNQLDPVRDMHYQARRDEPKVAKENILRLFYHSAKLDKKAEDGPRERSLVMPGVCFKLSASLWNANERNSAGSALDQLWSFLNDVLAENHIANDQRDSIIPLRRRFREIVGGPHFVNLTSEELFQELLGVFIPRDSPGRQEVPDSLPNMSS